MEESKSDCHHVLVDVICSTRTRKCTYTNISIARQMLTRQERIRGRKDHDLSQTTPPEVTI